MQSERYPSLEIVFTELKSILHQQSDHVDALDSKASIIIGFTALVVGVAVGQAPTAVTYLRAAALLFGLASFLFAVRAFWVRSFKALPRPREFYEQFAGETEEQSMIVLCNLAVDAFEENAAIGNRKAWAIKSSLFALIGSVLLFVLEFVIRGVR
jgi:hypothetical protein